MSNTLVWIILIPVFLLAALSLLPLFTRPSQPPREECWKGVFYVDPDDPALFVPKRFGIGYTLNFGNRWAWVVLVLIMLIALAPIILSLHAARQISKFR